MTSELSTPPAQTTETGLLNQLMSSLNEERRLMARCTGAPGNLPEHFHRNNLLDCWIEKTPNGWAANVSFRDIPPGQPVAVGTPDAHSLRTRAEALTAGHHLVEMIATGQLLLPLYQYECKFNRFDHR